MKYSVLSICEDIVKIESEKGKIDFVKLNDMPKGISINDILEKTDSGYIRLLEETENRQNVNIRIQDTLWEE